MLLGRVLGELSHPISSNCFNLSGHDDDSEVGTVASGCATSSPELNLHLEFFNRRKELLLPEQPENAEPSSVSVPFQWEEKPGKPKNCPQESTVAALTLPPVKKSGHFSRHSLDNVNLVANSPRTLSSRLRSILQPKFSHNMKVYEGRDELGVESEKVALNVGVHYPEEFQWRSLRNSSPVSIFEGPDDSPSSSSSMSLLSYCNNNNSSSNKQLALSCSSAKHNSVPALLANRLIPITDMLNAVPVETNDGRLSRVHQEVGRIKDVKSLVGFDSLNSLRRRSRNYKSSRSLSFGGPDFDYSCEEQPKRMLIQQAKLDQYHAIVGHKVDSYSLSAAPVALTNFSSGVAASDPYLSNNSSIESAKLGFPHTSTLGHSNNSLDYPRSKNLDKVKRDFRDSYVELEAEYGQNKLIDNHGNKFQDVKKVPKRSFMQQRMNIGGCCSTRASRTVNCCSSRRETKTTNPSLHKEKKASLPKHRKIQMEWRNLYGKDEIQKKAHI